MKVSFFEISYKKKWKFIFSPYSNFPRCTCLCICLSQRKKDCWVFIIGAFSWVCFSFLNGVLCAWNCPNRNIFNQNLNNDIHVRLIALYSYSLRNSLICVSFNFLLKFLWGMIENSIKCLELKKKDLIDTIILWLFICLCLSTNMAQ